MQKKSSFAQGNVLKFATFEYLALLSSFLKSFSLFFCVLLECPSLKNLFRYQICSLKCPDRLILYSWFKSYVVKPLKRHILLSRNGCMLIPSITRQDLHGVFVMSPFHPSIFIVSPFKMFMVSLFWLRGVALQDPQYFSWHRCQHRW